MINSLIFDLGGVVVNYPLDLSKRIFNKFGDLFAINASLLNSTYENHLVEIQTGQISLLEFYKKTLREMNRMNPLPKNLVAKHLEIYARSIKDNQDMLHLIKQLRQKYQVACFTNTETEIAAFSRAQGLFDYFDRAFVSTELGLRKPDIQAYLTVSEQLGILPNEALFVDDIAANVSAAQSAGMNGIVYHNLTQLRKALARSGIHVDYGAGAQ